MSHKDAPRFGAVFGGNLDNDFHLIVPFGNRQRWALCNSRIRLDSPFNTTSSPGYGDSNAGRSGIGTSSMRYTVPPVLMPYVEVVNATVAPRVVAVSFGSRAMYGMRPRCSRAGCEKLPIGSDAIIRAASASPRASVSEVVNSPGLKRG